MDKKETEEELQEELDRFVEKQHADEKVVIHSKFLSICNPLF